jgi:hypothetical protein
VGEGDRVGEGTGCVGNGSGDIVGLGVCLIFGGSFGELFSVCGIGAGEAVD